MGCFRVEHDHTPHTPRVTQWRGGDAIRWRDASEGKPLTTGLREGGAAGEWAVLRD